MQRVILVVGGVVAGVLLVLGLAAVVWDGDDGPEVARPASTEFPAIDHDPAAATELIGVWERWRTASFVTIGEWSRTLDGQDQALTGPTYLAQLPPRRVHVRLGSVIEEIDDTVARCDLPSEELLVPDCIAAETSRSYGERVADEMVVVREYVEGDARIYDVGFGELPGCFRVELEVDLLRVPWGRWSEFCFDDPSGAMVSARTRRQSAVDREAALEIRIEVDDLDFEVGE